MFAEVILSQRFPKYLGIFDYQVPESLAGQIKTGQLVQIPFRNAMREGVVIRLKSQSIAGKTIKSLDKIKNTIPVLTAEQLSLAEWLSAHYFVSVGSVIKMILPPIPIRKGKSPDIKLIKTAAIQTDHVIQKNVQAFIYSKNKHWLYSPTVANEARAFVKQFLQSASGTTLIVVPTIPDIESLRTLLPANGADPAVIFHGGLGKHDHYLAYESVRAKSCRIIIGTKLSLFLPFHGLQYVLLTQSENRNHKQSDQNPRYDARTVALKLSELHRAKTLFCSHAPAVEQHQSLKDGSWSSLAAQPAAAKPYLIVDMREERKKRASRILSESLIKEMRASLARKQSVFLYVNRRGSSSSVACRDCGLAIACPACRQPLVYHSQSKMLFCHQCNVKFPLPSTCKKCGGVNFKFLGTGSQQVEQEVKKYWPNNSVTRLDRDSDKQIGAITTNIIIGTEMAIPYVDWSQIGTTGIINADSLLYLPDFRSGERTWQQITLFHYLTGQPCVVQTNTPEYTVINALAKNKPDLLYRQELTDRMLLNYPPYTHLFKLIISHPDKSRCVQEAQRVRSMFQASRVSAAILTPLRPFIRKRWYMYVVLKIPFSMPEEKIKALVAQVPAGWQIDREPASLL
ncbi:MAG: primosomal protein N' [Patescibacteria group bacterium]